MGHKACYLKATRGSDEEVEMEGRSEKLRWSVMGVTVLLGLALMLGAGSYYQTANEVCSLYTDAPAKAQDLYETYKALLNW